MLEGIFKSHRWWVIRVERSIPERNSRSQIVLDVRYIHPARIPELRKLKGVPFSKALYNYLFVPIALYKSNFNGVFFPNMDWMYPRLNAKQLVRFGSIHLHFRWLQRWVQGDDNPKYVFFWLNKAPLLFTEFWWESLEAPLLRVQICMCIYNIFIYYIHSIHMLYIYTTLYMYQYIFIHVTCILVYILQRKLP